MKLKFFRTAAEFRAWLRRNHATARELVVGFYKRGAGKPSITWPESVDEARNGAWPRRVSRRSRRAGRPQELAARYARMLARNAAGRKYFLAQTPSYRRAVTWWVLSARAETTRLRRAQTLVALSAKSQLIPLSSAGVPSRSSCKPPAGRYYRTHSDGVKTVDRREGFGLTPVRPRLTFAALEGPADLLSA